MMVSSHCYKCYGSGSIRKRNMIGLISFIQCKHCKGWGKVMVQHGSGEWKLGQKIGAVGQSPGITQHENDRGWNRR